MKKVLLIALLALSASVSSQENKGYKVIAINGEPIEDRSESFFKYSPEGLIWQKVYQDSLDIENQTINIIMKNKKKYKKSGFIGLQWQFMDKADIKVEHNEGRTRITIKNITIKTHSLYGGDKHFDLDDVVLKNNNGKPRPWWKNRDQYRLQKYFLNIVEVLQSVEDNKKDF